MSETFGRYTVIRQLGRGAMGVVYLASDPMLNREVAVKTVDLGIAEEEEREFLRSRLLRDARAAAVLKHPHIVGIYDVFEDGPRAFVVMEYVDGDNLASLLKANPLPDFQLILKVLRQMADALDYTHARGVIHRDIKPANVMIDGAGNAKIMDFGIARITDSRTVTPTGMVMGTVEYMAPEQVLGVAMDGRADQFALAVVAYQMMTGSTLFGPNTLATLTYKIVNEAPTPPSTRNAALPRGVDAVLAKGLSKNPEGRFAGCGEFVGALAQAFSQAPTGPVAAPTAPLRTAPTETMARSAAATMQTTAAMPPARSSKTGVVAAAAVAALVVGGGLAVVVWKPWNRTAETQPPVTAAATPAAAAPAVEVPKPEAKTEAPAAPAKSEPAVSKAEPKLEAKTEPSPPAKTAPPPAAAKAAEPDPIDEPEPMVFTPEPAPKKGGKATPFSIAMQTAQQLERQNNYPGAIQSLTQALSLRPKAPLALYNRGLALQHQEQYEAAIKDYSDALHVDAKMTMAYIGLGGCLVHLHRDPEALEEFQRALELKPEAINALSGLGGIYFRRKQYRLALQDYDKALAINPRFAPGYTGRARTKEAMGDLAGAAADRKRESELRRR